MADRTRLAGGCASMSSRRKCDLERERERESSKMASRLDCCSICHHHLCFGGTVVSITTTNINAGQCPALTCLCSELRLHRILRKDSQLYRDRFLWRYVYTLYWSCTCSVQIKRWHIWNLAASVLKWQSTWEPVTWQECEGGNNFSISEYRSNFSSVPLWLQINELERRQWK